MFKRLTLMTAMTVAVIGGMAAERNNPFLEPYNTPYNIPPFDRITTADYMPALEEGLKIYRGEIDAIANQKATPTFDNTILAMEKSGELTTRVMGVLMSLSEADSNPELQKVADEAMLLYGSTVDNVMMNDKLFERVKYLYDNRAKLGLSGPRLRAVEKSYRDFTRNGALLSAADKEELKKLNNRLTELYSKFNSNLLKATNSYQLVVDDPAMLSGLLFSNVVIRRFL